MGICSKTSKFNPKTTCRFGGDCLPQRCGSETHGAPDELHVPRGNQRGRNRAYGPFGNRQRPPNQRFDGERRRRLQTSTTIFRFFTGCGIYFKKLCDQKKACSQTVILWSRLCGLNAILIRSQENQRRNKTLY